MKNIILAIFIALLNGAVFAQFTKGGSEKNYERHRVSYDSIVTERKVLVENAKAQTSHFTALQIGYVSAMDANSKMQMNQNEFLNSVYSAAPYYTGKMGLNNGFSLNLVGQTPLDGINKNLIRNIDIGINFKILGFATLRYDWKEIYKDKAYAFYDMFQNGEYKNFNFINIGFGPSVTYINNPDKPLFYIDAYIRYNLSLTFGGSFNGSTLFDNGTSVETLFLSIENEDLVWVNFNPTIGVNFRIKNFMIFLESNLGMRPNMFESTVTENLSGLSINYSSNVPISDRLKFAHLQIGIGVTF